jgi:hypothetical protein
MKNVLKISGWLLAGWIITSCSISYKFNQSSIDYTKVSSISIKDFLNMAPLVYAPLSQQFTEALKDKYTRQTKLRVIREGGDFDLEGEITGYNFAPMAVSDNMYASQTRLTITTRIRFTDRTNPDNDFEKSFSAYSEFDNTNTIDQVQDQLCEFIMKEIIDQVFNETVAKW